MEFNFSLGETRKDWIKLGAITGVVEAVIIAGILSATVAVLGDLVIQIIKELWSQTISPDVLGFGFLITLLAVLVIFMPILAAVNGLLFAISSKILNEFFSLFEIRATGYRAVIYVSTFAVVLVYSFELIAMFVYSVVTGDIIGIQGIVDAISSFASFIFNIVLVVVSAIVAAIVWKELLKNDVEALKI